MFCGQCGSGVADRARFCEKCGTPMGSAAISPKAARGPAASPPGSGPITFTAEDVYADRAPASPPPSRGRARYVMAGAGVVALLVIGAVFVANATGFGDDPNSPEALDEGDRSGVCTAFSELLTWSADNPPPEGMWTVDEHLQAADAQDQVADAIQAMRAFVPEGVRASFDATAAKARAFAERVREDPGGFLGSYAESLPGGPTDITIEFVESACGTSWPGNLEPEVPYND